MRVRNLVIRKNFACTRATFLQNDKWYHFVKGCKAFRELYILYLFRVFYTRVNNKQRSKYVGIHIERMIPPTEFRELLHCILRYVFFIVYFATVVM